MPFSSKRYPPIEITINNVTVKSSKTINVLGVTFDHKLTWSNHISNQINKANRALHAIRLIKKVFQSKRDIDIADIKLLFHLVLQQWSLALAKTQTWTKTTPPLSFSKCPKISPTLPWSYGIIYKFTQVGEKSPPDFFLIFKHAVLLHKLFNTQSPSLEWMDLNFKQTFGQRQTKFLIINPSRFKIGNNILANRLTILNN